MRIADCGLRMKPEGASFYPHSRILLEATDMTLDPKGPRGFLTLVCLTCGNRKYYDDTPPNRVKCEKCGNTVFRNFFSPTEADEATIEQLEETRREIAFDDGSPGTAPDDINELNNP
jgi:ribosomal protein S27E